MHASVPPFFAPLCFCVGTVGTVGTPHKQGLPAFPLSSWQWEQWEQNAGRKLISAHFRASRPPAMAKQRAPNVQQTKSPVAPFGAFLIFQRERDLCPAPTRAARCPVPGTHAQRPVHTHACTGLARWLAPYTSKANSAGGMR